MERLSWKQATIMLAFSAAVTGACMGPRSELDLTTYDITKDQAKIAGYYRQEAARLRQKSEEMSARIAVYERLFGPASDWVAGTRLLAQSYEEAAKEHERLAGMHMGLVPDR